MRFLLAGLLALCAGVAFAANSTGGVVWLDALAYAKPTFIPIALPTVVTDYYIDMTSGSDSGSCTCGTNTGNACKTLRGLIMTGGTGAPSCNRSGLRGNAGDGAAAINIKGTGNGAFYSFDSGSGVDTCIKGTSGKEVLIRPWGGSAVTFNRGGANQGLNGVSNACQYIIIDGGDPSNGTILFEFFNDDNCDVCYSLAITGSNITVARVKAHSNGTIRPELFAVCNTNNETCNNVGFINVEMYDNNAASDQSNAIYYGACDGNGSCAINNGFIKNSIIRNQSGEGIEANPRVQSSGMTITGNAIHNVGKNSCSSSWDCRPGITLFINQSGTFDDVVVANNLIWNTGVGCIWDSTDATGAHKTQIYNNTCYDYHKSTASGVCVQGICSSATNSVAIVRNNIIYATNGTDPFDASPFTADHNFCGVGKSCGTSSQHGTLP